MNGDPGPDSINGMIQGSESPASAIPHIPGQRLAYTSLGNSESPYVFALIHGAWHSSEHWALLQRQLEAKGHAVIAPDLPSADTSANFDDDANVVLDSLGDHTNIFLVGHSRGSEMIPRVARIAVEKMVGAAALNSSGPYGYIPHIRQEEDVEPPRHTFMFSAGITEVENSNGLTIYDATFASKVLYHDVADEAVVLSAISKLRPQRAPETNMPVSQLPSDLPVFYIRGTEDPTITEERALWVARNYYHTNIIDFPGGHTPQLARPKRLAELFIRLAEEAQLQRNRQKS